MMLPHKNNVAHSAPPLHLRVTRALRAQNQSLQLPEEEHLAQRLQRRRWNSRHHSRHNPPETLAVRWPQLAAADVPTLVCLQKNRSRRRRGPKALPKLEQTERPPAHVVCQGLMTRER